MNVILLIDNLDSGGAERQCAVLATMLAADGHRVRILGYCGGDFYLPAVAAAGVDYRCLATPNAFSRIREFRRQIRQAAPDAVIAFLQIPALLGELAALPRRNWRLIVSERSFLGDRIPLRSRYHQYMHSIADFVTTNSRRNARRMLAANPLLRNKLRVVYNAVDLEKFHPAAVPPIRAAHAPLHVLCVASHQVNKNAAGLIRALALLPPAQRPIVDWFGSSRGATGNIYTAYQQAVELAAQLRVERHLAFYPPDPDIITRYQAADVLLLPSFQEGLPNVVCEAMACGLPILMGERVSDAGRLVQTGENGFHFSPEAPDSIAAALSRMAAIPATRRREMGRASRCMAEKLFSPDRFYRAYRRLLPEGGGTGSQSF